MMKSELLNSLKGYTLKSLASDLAAGVTIGAIVFPLALALGIASGVAPERGIVTAIVAGLVIACLGGSRVQIGGPTGAFLVIAYGIIQKHGYSALVTATVMAGILILLAGVFKFGGIIKFIPYPVIAGFTVGIAVYIVTAAIGDLCGFVVSKMPGDCIGNIAVYASSPVTFDPWALGTGIATLSIIVALRKISRRLPGSLVAIVAVTTAVWLLKFPVDTIGSRYGSITTAFTSPVFPSFSFSLVRELFLPALAIAFVASIESLMSAVVAAGVIGRRHNSNMELFALGIANVASALFGGIPAAGSIARTASNVECGGRTPIAALAHTLTILLLMLCLGRFVTHIPMAAIAAILVSVAWNMAGFSALKTIVIRKKSDAVILVVTFALTVFIDLTLAIAISLLFFAAFCIRKMIDVSAIKEIKYEMSLSDGSKAGDAADSNGLYLREIPKRVLVYEIEGPLVFGTIEMFMRTFLSASSGCDVLILRMRRTIYLDAGALRILEGLVSDCRMKGIALFVSDIHTQPFMLAVNSGLDEKIGKDRIFGNLDEALAASAGLVGVTHEGKQ